MRYKVDIGQTRQQLYIPFSLTEGGRGAHYSGSIIDTLGNHELLLMINLLMCSRVSATSSLQLNSTLKGFSSRQRRAIVTVPVGHNLTRSLAVAWKIGLEPILP
jgi:hypothetical protein